MRKTKTKTKTKNIRPPPAMNLNIKGEDGKWKPAGGDPYYAVNISGRKSGKMYIGPGARSLGPIKEEMNKLLLNTMKLTFMLGYLDDNSVLQFLSSEEDLLKKITDLNFVYTDVNDRWARTQTRHRITKYKPVYTLKDKRKKKSRKRKK